MPCFCGSRRMSATSDGSCLYSEYQAGQISASCNNWRDANNLSSRCFWTTQFTNCMRGTSRHAYQWDWLSGCCYVISGRSPVSITMSWRDTCHACRHLTKLPIPLVLLTTWLGYYVQRVTERTASHGFGLQHHIRAKTKATGNRAVFYFSCYFNCPQPLQNSKAVRVEEAPVTANYRKMERATPMTKQSGWQVLGIW
jgi:hypothetical protein